MASGKRRPFDALIVATGSTPRHLDAELLGVNDAVTSGRLSTLHSMNDAVCVRDLLSRGPHPAHVVIFGAGLVAAETSSLLHHAAHDIVLVARLTNPGVFALGEVVANRIAELHGSHVVTHFGRTPRALTAREDHLGVVGTGLALLVFFWLIASVGATKTSIVAYLVPVAALLYGVLLLGEPLTVGAVAGLALILAGVVAVSGLFRPPRRSRKAPPAP